MTYRSFTSFAEAQAFDKFKDGDDVWVGGSSLASDDGAGRFVFRSGATGEASNDRIVVPNGRLLRTSSTDRAMDRLAELVAAKIKPELDELEEKADAQALALANLSANLPTATAAAIKSGAPVQVAGDGLGGASALDIGEAVAGSLLIDGVMQTVLPPAVIAAIGAAAGAAVDERLRAAPLTIEGGAAGVSPQYPPGTNVSLPLAVTLANGTEQEVVMLGVALPRSIAIFPAATDTVRVRFRAEAGGDWIEPPESMAVTSASPADNKRHSLDAPIYSIGITRTVGAGTTSKVVVS